MAPDTPAKQITKPTPYEVEPSSSEDLAELSPHLEAFSSDAPGLTIQEPQDPATKKSIKGRVVAGVAVVAIALGATFAFLGGGSGDKDSNGVSSDPSTQATPDNNTEAPATTIPQPEITKSGDDAAQWQIFLNHINYSIASGNVDWLHHVFLDKPGQDGTTTSWAQTFVEQVEQAKSIRETEENVGNTYRNEFKGELILSDDSDPSLGRMLVSYHSEANYSGNGAGDSVNHVEDPIYALALVQRDSSSPEDHIAYLARVTPAQLSQFKQDPSLLKQYTLAFVGQ